MNNRGLSLPMRVLCAIVFCTFSFCYLYFYQADLMIVSQHLASRGQTHYVPLTGAVLITIALLLIQTGVYKLTRLYKRSHALTYLPSASVLVFITSLPSDVTDEISIGWRSLWFLFAIVLFFAVAFFLRRVQSIEPEVRWAGISSQLTWMNLSVLFLMLWGVCLLSNTDEMFHRQIRMERMIMEHDVEGAIEVGQQTQETSPSLALVRGYALTLRRQMGDRFFEVPVPKGSSCLIPDRKGVRTLLLPREHVEWVAQKGVDFQLTKLLLDRKLDAFAHLLRKYYDFSKPLPKHYREALMIYGYIFPHPFLTFKNEKLAREFTEFRKMAKVDNSRSSATLGAEERQKLHQQYGKTYWYYYFMNL